VHASPPRSVKAAEASVAKGGGGGMVTVINNGTEAVIATAVRRDYVDCNT
jgi:hypothetical protein